MRVWNQEAELKTPPNADASRTQDTPFIRVRSAAFDELTNATGTEFEYVMLQSADGSLILQLIEYMKGGSGELELDHARAGSVHLSFFVDDVEVQYDAIKQRDAQALTSAIVQNRTYMRTFYAQDPDGVPVEFLQVSPPPSAS